MATTQVELVTPERTMFSGQAEMVVCRSADGDIAFLADHMAYLGALEPYLLRVVHPQESPGEGSTGAAAPEELHFAVHGGFVEVHDNRVIALCDVAEPADQIDVARAERARDRAQARLATDPEDAEAKAALRRAEVRLEVAVARLGSPAPQHL
jgi:F-type H+-transporting ATPase subunit epsilon